MDVTRPEEGDVRTIRKLVYESMRASFALSPDEIESALERWFGADDLVARLDDEDAHDLVARDDDQIVGFVRASLTASGDAGVVECLHVDPARRGEGAGTALFERAREAMIDAGAGETRAHVLTDDAEGGTFYEQFDMVAASRERTEIAGTPRVLDVYSDAADAAEPAAAPEPVDLEEIPDEVDTDEGRFPVDREEVEAGTKGPFLRALSDREGGELVGYYCTNCGNLVETTDGMGRIECEECGNVHRADDWDGAYL